LAQEASGEEEIFVYFHFQLTQTQNELQT